MHTLRIRRRCLLFITQLLSLFHSFRIDGVYCISNDDYTFGILSSEQKSQRKEKDDLVDAQYNFDRSTVREQGIILVETKKAFVIYELLDSLCFREANFELKIVVVSNFLQKFVGFNVKAAGIQCEDPDIGINLGCHIN